MQQLSIFIGIINIFSFKKNINHYFDIKYNNYILKKFLYIDLNMKVKQSSKLHLHAHIRYIHVYIICILTSLAIKAMMRLHIKLYRFQVNDSLFYSIYDVCFNHIESSFGFLPLDSKRLSATMFAEIVV